MRMKRCRCGVFKTAGEKWRVLIRGAEDCKSLLKCLQCGHRWKSKCKYIAGLRDHKERSRKGMTDQDILERINNASLIVDRLGHYVISKIDGVEKHLTIIERERKGFTYRFTSICHRGKKKKIGIHRLVWMSR